MARRRRLFLLSLGLVGAIGAIGAARAEPPAPGLPASDDRRFVLQPVENGFVRLDTQTGQTSLCLRQNEQWQCRIGPDERLALEGEIARLKQERAALLRRLAAEPPPDGRAPGAAAPPPGTPAPPAGTATPAPAYAWASRALHFWRETLAGALADIRHLIERLRG